MDLASASKPPELEDALNRVIYHPLSRRLAVALCSTPVSPNMVSITGGLLIVAAGVAYTTIAWPWGFLIGFALHLSWHVVDGADGDLARMTGKASAFGELVDGMCDYGGHIVLYIMLAAMLDDTLGAWGWAAAVAAGLSRIVQSNFSESQRRTYLWRVYGIPWLQQSRGTDDALSRERSRLSRLFGSLADLYLKLSRALRPSAQPMNALMARISSDARGKKLVARISRAAFSVTAPLERMLGPNPRTLLLGASMALGSPLWFFLIECSLNLVLVAAIIRANRVEQRILRALKRSA